MSDPRKTPLDQLLSQGSAAQGVLGAHPLELPIAMVPQATVLPRRYVIHKKSQWCKNCGTVHSWSDTYAFNEMMTRTGSGKPVMNLVPVSEFRFNLPIEVVAIARREVPVCHECPDRLSLSHLPDPRSTDEWKRIYHFAAAPEAKKRSAAPLVAKVSKSTKTTKTIDDLL